MTHISTRRNQFTPLILDNDMLDKHNQNNY